MGQSAILGTAHSSGAAHASSAMTHSGGESVSDTHATTAYTMQMDTRTSLPPTNGLDPWVPPIVALIGVLFGLWVKWRSDKRERRLTAKEKIYLKVIESLHDSSIAIATFGDLEVPSTETMSRLASLQHPIAQAEVVARMPLINALSALRDQMFGYAVEMLKIRMKVDAFKSQISVSEPFIKQTQDKIEANLAEQRRINIDGGHPDPDRFGRLQRDFAFLQDHQTQFYSKNNASWQEINKRIATLATMSGEFAANLIEPQADVLQLIRQELEELGEKFDKASYLQMKAKTSVAAKKAIADIYDAAVAAFGQQQKEDERQVNPAQPVSRTDNGTSPKESP